MSARPFDLPPLNLIEGFEATARHLSFTKAAAELFLTQSAISRQIKTLEDRLGVSLFERRPRVLVLTPAGETLYRTVADVLRRIDETTRALRRTTGPRTFTIATTPAFASLWLIPRLAGFMSAHPGVDVRISASTNLLDLERARIEVAIRYVRSDAPDAGERLFGEDVMPVCAPSLLRAAQRPLQAPADLAHQVLLHYDDPLHAAPMLDWPTWLHAVGLAGLSGAGALRFSQYDQVIFAAVNGQGVALGRSPLIRRLLRSKELVAPFRGSVVAAPRGYHVVVTRTGARNADVGAFVDWVRAEVAKDRTA